MTGRTFGRKMTEDDGLARRREAFLASERERREQLAHTPSGFGSDSGGRETPSPPTAFSKPIFVREKSMGVAYLLWFFCGMISAHRFYLGYPSSAVTQACLWIVSWMMIAAGFLMAVLGLIAAFLWVLSDVFVIPGLCRRANERARQNAASYAFA